MAGTLTGFFLLSNVVGPASGTFVVLEGCWVDFFEADDDLVSFALAFLCLLRLVSGVVCAKAELARSSGNRMKRTRVVGTVLMSFPLNAFLGIGFRKGYEHPVV